MMQTEHRNVRLAFASLIPLFFVIGCGAGIVFIPFSIAEFAGHGLAWLAGVILLTPLIHGVFAVVVLLAGFPAYVFLARKRGGFAVHLVRVTRFGGAVDH